MAKLRHIAITVSDLEKGAQFYEKVFELKRVRAIPGILVALTDGVVFDIAREEHLWTGAKL